MCGIQLEKIGATPIVPLRRLSEAVGAEILVKAEFLNPGGSVKDRIALAMIRDAERTEKISPGATLVEATAGNTGIALAWIAATLGYRFVAVMTEADRGPKVEAIEAAGAEVILLPRGRPWNSQEGPLGAARRIARQCRGHFLNQFSNQANPRAHEQTTAVEIQQALDHLDAVVVGVGSGGTAIGIARGLKPVIPGIRILGAVSVGSFLAWPQCVPAGRIPGITSDFMPEIFERSWIDRVETVRTDDAATATRCLAEVEGLPAGHSSGACLWVAMNEAYRRPGSRILLIASDGMHNYPELNPCRCLKPATGSSAHPREPLRHLSPFDFRDHEVL